MAFVYEFLVTPINILDGGLVDIALIFTYLLNIKTGIIYLFLNIPNLLWF